MAHLVLKIELTRTLLHLTCLSLMNLSGEKKLWGEWLTGHLLARHCVTGATSGARKSHEAIAWKSVPPGWSGGLVSMKFYEDHSPVTTLCPSDSKSDGPRQLKALPEYER